MKSKLFSKKLQMPNALVLLFSIMIVMMVLTWIIPAGEFERTVVEDRTVLIPDSFHFIEASPQNPFQLILALPQAFIEVGSIVFFLFITGGSFKLINETGILEALMGRLVRALKGREEIFIPILVFVTGLGGATLGLSEEIILFIPIGIALARALGYDAMTGIAVLILGAAVGFNSGFMNPFSVGVAQALAELPLFSGVGLRIAMFIVLWAVTTFFIMRYAKKVKADPSKSAVADLEAADRAADDYTDLNDQELPAFSTRHKWISLALLAGFAMMVYGVFQIGWFIDELGAMFFTMAVVSALIGGLSTGKIADTFVAGAGEMMFSVLAIVFARGILVVMENGMILDTIIFYLVQVVNIFPAILGSVGMYVIQILINFFIPSGSGQAAATMPIMLPIADSLDVTRQTAVLAFQLGSGFMDSIIPTSGVLMAELSLAKIPYNKWFKWFLPLLAIYILIGLAFLIFAHVIGYGPF
ncbi:Na+/H+ antiporter NhaC family protein [Aerococcaceae bacterium 50-4]